MNSERGDGSNETAFRFGHTIRAVQDAASFQLTGRTIIILLDGTGDKFDGDCSNIIHLMSCLKKSDSSQVTYYQSGIGTYDAKGLSNGLNSALDAAIGAGLGTHIRDAYRFLMQNYNEGDKVCLFGFSRGSYTARCLAGFIHRMGVLPAGNDSQVDFAYRMYKDDSPEAWSMSKDFKRAFCMNVSVYFIGVFDSVASVGLIPRTLPLSSTPTVKSAYFRHCMALDERRSKFKAFRFRQKLATTQGSGWKQAVEMSAAESRFLSSQPETDVLEVWFTGCHCDVGGGAVKNEVRNRLANIPLRWMIRQTFLCNTGILWKTDMLAEEGLDIHALSPVYLGTEPVMKMPSKDIVARWEAGDLPAMTTRSNILEEASESEVDGSKMLKMSSARQTLEHGWLPEHVEDYFDSRAEINDMLKISKPWWILELLPTKVVCLLILQY